MDDDAIRQANRERRARVAELFPLDTLGVRIALHDAFFGTALETDQAGRYRRVEVNLPAALRLLETLQRFFDAGLLEDTYDDVCRVALGFVREARQIDERSPRNARAYQDRLTLREARYAAFGRDKDAPLQPRAAAPVRRPATRGSGPVLTFQRADLDDADPRAVAFDTACGRSCGGGSAGIYVCA